jgi:uncharacterized protein YpiB (UPF0302 family)
MTLEELQSAIVLTKQQIDELKQQIEEAVDFKAKRRLSRQLKELQYLQLWHLDQLDALGKNDPT